jgi:hypothetical protein
MYPGLEYSWTFLVGTAKQLAPIAAGIVNYIFLSSNILSIPLYVTEWK